jgi:hypothetical protein
MISVASALFRHSENIVVNEDIGAVEANNAATMIARVMTDPSAAPNVGRGAGEGQGNVRVGAMGDIPAESCRLGT